MSKKDIFGDELKTAEPQDFETMLNQSMGVSRRLKVGDLIKGEILSIGKEQAFVSTGTPTDGALPTRELLDKDQNRKYSVGDTVSVRVMRVRG